jgi:hypothetical protein
MHVARESPVRTIVGMAAGIVLGCGVTVSTLVVLADVTPPIPGGSWLSGAGLIQLAYGPVLVLGALVGSRLGRRFGWQPQRPPWTRRPRGTVLNHYLPAIFGGAILGALSLVFLIPSGRVVVEMLNGHGDVIMPRIARTTDLLMYAVAIVGALSVARSTVHVLDRDIHARRRMRDALKALDAIGGGP